MLLFSVEETEYVLSGFNFGRDAVQLLKSGMVRVFMPFISKTLCQINMEYFPYDIQECPVVIQPWTYNKDMVDFTDMVVIHEDNASSGQWKAVGRPTCNKENRFYYSANETFSVIYCTVKYQRYAVNHVISFIFPAFMLNIIGSLTYFLPPEAGERVSLGVTSYLSFSVMALMVSERIPETNTVPVMCK